MVRYRRKLRNIVQSFFDGDRSLDGDQGKGGWTTVQKIMKS